MTVFINTSRFDPGPQYGNLATSDLVYSTDSTEELLGWALKGLGRIYRPGYRYKKAGVMLNRLTPADALSMRMFGRRKVREISAINEGRG